MRINKKIIGLGLFVLIGIFLIIGVYAYSSFETTSSSTYTNYQTSPSFQSYYSQSDINTYWPVLATDAATCKERVDMLLQPTPAGCQPAVVRSDLLAEQNVPVFCQIDAVQINPLIDIKEISSISFSGQYPPEVVGTGFHPARAALRSRDRLLGSPVINNIGYVVVILKKNEIEKTLPDFVEVNLTARIGYESGNALGIGQAEFKLSPIGDIEWGDSSDGEKQSFWQGRYFVRLNSVDSNSALVSIYENDRQISSTRVEKGKISKDIFLPGFYCRAGLSISYEGLDSAQDKATIAVRSADGTDIVDVYEGSRFNNGKCAVRDIEINEKDGKTGKVSVNCGSKTVELALGKILFEAGDKVTYKNNAGEVIASSAGGMYKIKVGEVESVVEESDIKLIGEKKFNCDIQLDESVSEEFSKSVDYAEELLKKYPAEPPEQEVKSAEQAIYDVIGLATDLNQYRVAQELYDKFIEQYPNSKYKSDLRLSLGSGEMDRCGASKVIEVDSRFKVLSLMKLEQPKQNPSAIFNIATGYPKKKIAKGSIGGVDRLISLQVNEVKPESASVKYTCANLASGDSNAGGGTATIKLGEDETLCGNVIVKLEDVELEKVAKIKLIPTAEGTSSEVPLIIKIGIEKRAIKLSPDKAQERANNINKSIEKFEKISENLGNVVEGMTAACLLTGATLTTKNFLSGLTGTSLARKQVMSGSGGWTEKCEVMKGEYGGSISKCFSAHSDDISKDVEAYKNALNKVNADIKQIESANTITSSGIFGGKSVNAENAAPEILNKISSECSNQKVNVTSDKSVVLGELIGSDSYKNGDIGYQDLKDLYSNCLISKGTFSASSVGALKAQTQLNNFGREVYDLKTRRENEKKLSSMLEQGLRDRPILSYGSKDSVEGVYHGGVLKSGDYGLSLEAEQPAEVIQYGNKLYLVILSAYTTTDYKAKEVYELSSRDGGKLIAIRTTSLGADLGADLGAEITTKINGYKKLDSYNYPIIDPKVQYYETEPYKGFPAIVPLDVSTGWYVGTRQILPAFGAKSPYESSGRPSSFWICNVGINGRADLLSNFGDDVGCTQINLDTGQSLYKIAGLSESAALALVNQAVKALNQAADQYGNKRVVINGKEYEVGGPAANVPSAQCEDFNSPGECRLLYNVCDPVICPSSRCDFGGSYPVPNVVQSGIFGSTLLCLPNFPEVAVPVCLTGIKAGLDAYTSVLKAHRDCLQEAVNTGRSVGICDELYSIYMCDLIWKQAAPLAQIAVPKTFEFLSGAGKNRGGGEYNVVSSAWENSKESVNFFVNSYGVNTVKAFQARSVEEVGTTDFCKVFASVKAPKGFKSLLEPASPPQIYAWFSSTKYTDVTVPATAQYKVFYHIYGGGDSGVQYNVYLKSAPESSYYNIPSSVMVPEASGFIPRGGYVSETKDFTAPEGYKELCVRVNGDERCGFGQVTTEEGLNMLKDKLLEGELTKKDINSETACVSGTASLAGALTPNPQAVAESVLSSDVSQRGIVRICASDNPGSLTEPERFVDVGHCGNTKIRCWLDKNSVGNALSDRNLGTQNATLAELEKIEAENLAKQGFVLDAAGEQKKINDLQTIIDGTDVKIKERVIDTMVQIEQLAEKLAINHQKAKLMLLKVEFQIKYVRELALGAVDIEQPTPVPDLSETEAGSAGTGAEINGDVDTKSQETEYRYVLGEEIELTGLLSDNTKSVKVKEILNYSDLNTPTSIFLSESGTVYYIYGMKNNEVSSFSVVGKIEDGQIKINDRLVSSLGSALVKAEVESDSIIEIKNQINDLDNLKIDYGLIYYLHSTIT